VTTAEDRLWRRWGQRAEEIDAGTFDELRAAAGTVSRYGSRSRRPKWLDTAALLDG
jgi:hypothetical protein